SLLRPWQIRREAQALAESRREELLALAQAQRDAADIRAGRKRLRADGSVVALPNRRRDAIADKPIIPSPETLADEPPLTASQIAAQNVVADSIRKEANVGRAVLAARPHLSRTGIRRLTKKAMTTGLTAGEKKVVKFRAKSYTDFGVVSSRVKSSRQALFRCGCWISSEISHGKRPLISRSCLALS